MKDLFEVISEHPFFSGLSEEYRRLVAGCGGIAAYEAGKFLFQSGTDAEHFFLIRRGRVALELEGPGERTHRFETLGAGEVLGWSWLFPPHRWQFDAIAVERTRVVRFDGKCLREKCEGDPALGYAIMKRFAHQFVRRFVDLRLQLIDIYGQPRE